jgi:FtsP/CotA-like multicopper oxidase with cupredoxin domain
MDGPVGITQCAIKQWGQLTYQVPIGDQAGTFWQEKRVVGHQFTLTWCRYHAHSEVQRGDGLYGGLVVHNPITSPENIKYQYDNELLFLVGDWYHWPAARVLATFMSPTSTGVEVCSFVSLQEI